jgi:hypothetical protein
MMMMMMMMMVLCFDFYTGSFRCHEGLRPFHTNAAVTEGRAGERIWAAQDWRRRPARKEDGFR